MCVVNGLSQARVKLMNGTKKCFMAFRGLTVLGLNSLFHVCSELSWFIPLSWCSAFLFVN